jgi:hypothetical protein
VLLILFNALKTPAKRKPAIRLYLISKGRIKKQIRVTTTKIATSNLISLTISLKSFPIYNLRQNPI